VPHWVESLAADLGWYGRFAPSLVGAAGSRARTKDTGAMSCFKIRTGFDDLIGCVLIDGADGLRRYLAARVGKKLCLDEHTLS
jgi:hypothetical protein